MKKQQNINLEKENLRFEHEGELYKILHFNKTAQEVQIQGLDSCIQKKIVFAHLPKKLKKKLQPL